MNTGPLPGGDAPARAEEIPRGFIAYELPMNPGFVLEPAPARRQWMDDFPHRVPYRCLPINIANQAGWVVRGPAGFRVEWNGKHDLAGLKITFLESLDPRLEQQLRGYIKSNFGGGILTISMPWLFRTPPGVALWVRGPTNTFVDNAQAIEGIVESNWAHAPFTMNWKLTRRNAPAYFPKGDVICMVTPFPLDLLEGMDPQIRLINSEPELYERFRKAADERNATLRRAAEGGQQGFELNYMRGEQLDGSRWPNHKTNLKLREFADRRTDL